MNTMAGWEQGEVLYSLVQYWIFARPLLRRPKRQKDTVATQMWLQAERPSQVTLVHAPLVKVIDVAWSRRWHTALVQQILGLGPDRLENQDCADPVQSSPESLRCVWCQHSPTSSHNSQSNSNSDLSKSFQVFAPQIVCCPSWPSVLLVKR